MKKTHSQLLLGAVVLIALFVPSYFLTVTRNQARPPLAQPVRQTVKETFSYKGEDGKDALTILKEKTAVEQNASGMVVSINKRKADESKREFWSFYINGKQAMVGAGDYQTKSTDTILWKIETY